MEQKNIGSFLQNGREYAILKRIKNYREEAPPWKRIRIGNL
jgi:hypothetical protein